MWVMLMCVQSGKSAVINSLLGAEALPTYDVHLGVSQLPYTTATAQEVVTSMPGNEGLKVRFIDTPGLVFAHLEGEDREAWRTRDILLRCRGRLERLKNPLPASECTFDWPCEVHVIVGQ